MTDRKNSETKLLQEATWEKQVMGSGDARSVTPPGNDSGVIRTEDEVTVEEGATVEGEEEMLADDTQGDHSTVSTESSHDKSVFSPHQSPILEGATDPTSMPSEILDDLELDRKYTESPQTSVEAVHGSDSIHSMQSDPSTEDSDSREGSQIAVNPRKVEAIGGHFGESSTAASTSRFHDPKNSWEAHHIKNKIKHMNNTMDIIDQHPEGCFSDHGSSYQVSARPENPTKSALDVEDDIADKNKVHDPPDSVLRRDVEEAHNIRGPRQRISSCCIIM